MEFSYKEMSEQVAIKSKKKYLVKIKLFVEEIRLIYTKQPLIIYGIQAILQM